MDEAKHTPGPWENEHTQYDERISFDELRPSWVNIILASNVIIAETSHRDISLEEQEANAALIAAAPDLLEALEGMLELRPDDCSSQIYKIRQKAEKAIQKARGQG